MTDKRIDVREQMVFDFVDLKMSSKRFVLDYEDDDTIFIDDNKLKKHLTIRNVKIKMCDLNDIVDRLNQLDEENEELLKKEKHLHKVITRKDERINNLVRNKEQLKKENEQLRQSRDYWSRKTKEMVYYWECLERAIEKTFDSDDQCFDEIWKYYDEMEAKWEDE